MNYRQMKPVADTLLALFGVLFLTPVLFLLSLMILVFIGRPIIFSQLRPGQYGKPFSIYKFRSMTEEKDVEGNLLPDDMRLTRFGKFLRSTSLDELPALLNVIKGEMSLVGPRPLLMRYLDRYTVEQARRHEVRPGITGWAQINGRNAISWEEKFELDVWYVDNQSFWLDIRILWMTVVRVFKRKGISQAGQATMEEFRGTKRQ